MPSVIVDCFHDASGSSANGRHYWDFSFQFGPTFTTKDGRELAKQPGPA